MRLGGTFYRAVEEQKQQQDAPEAQLTNYRVSISLSRSTRNRRF